MANNGSLGVTPLLDTGVSAAVTGDWVQTNQRLSGHEQICFFASCAGGGAGDYSLEASPYATEELVVCIAPFTANATSHMHKISHYPYVRAKKAANAPGCKIVLVNY